MSNISKNIDSGSSRSVTPGSYKIKSIKLFTHTGDDFLIQNVVTKLIITESIYSNTLMCKLSVRDTTNMIENLPLIGQERIEIQLEHKPLSSKTQIAKIELEFYVTEYPLYGRSKREAYSVIFL